MAELRIGLIGAGMVAGHHLGAWAAQAGARVVAIADPVRERALERAQAFGIGPVFTDPAAMIATMKLDAVDIVAPVEHHAALCRLAAGQGLAIQCQKPLCPSLAEATELVSEIGDRVRFKVHENWRFRPVYRRLAAELAKGWLGSRSRVRMTCFSSGLLPDAEGRLPALLRQPFMAGLDRLLVFELLIHHLDVLEGFFGPLMVVDSRLGRTCPQVRGEDSARIRLRAAGGASVELAGGFAVPGAPPLPEDSFEITGEGGTIRFVSETLTIERKGAAPHSERFPAEEGYGAAYCGAIADFVEGLAAGRPFETEARAQLPVLALVEAIYAGSAIVPGSVLSPAQPRSAK